MFKFCACFVNSLRAFELSTNVVYPRSYLLSVLGVLQAVLAKCVDGAKIVDLCQMGDTLMLEETAKVYKKEKDLKKG